jgi:hypothetical protein
MANQYPKTMKKFGIDLINVETLSDNKLFKSDQTEFDQQIRFVQLKETISKEFSDIPNLDYAGIKKSIEQLMITKVAHQLDGRVIQFYENNKNDS